MQIETFTIFLTLLYRGCMQCYNISCLAVISMSIDCRPVTDFLKNLFTAVKLDMIFDLCKYTKSLLLEPQGGFKKRSRLDRE